MHPFGKSWLSYPIRIGGDMMMPRENAHAVIDGKVRTLEEALLAITDGCTLMYGGFGGIGTPPTLIEGILQKGT